MDDKRLGLALLVPGLWVSSIVSFVVYTLFSPFLFLGLLFSPSLEEIIAQLTEPFEIEIDW